MKMDREMDYAARIALSFFIATAAFAVVFAVSSYVVQYNLELTGRGNEYIAQYVTETGTYLSAFSCDEKLLREASSKLDEVGSNVAFLEAKIGKGDERVMEQKKLYSALELEHSRIVDNFNAKCGANFTKIFFVYSNTNEKDESEKTGFILTAYKNAHPETMIYSFDYDLESDAISSLKARYNVTSAPVVIVRGRSFEISGINDVDSILKDINY